MADIGRQLLAAAKAIFAAKVVSGGTLAALNSYWVDYTNTGNPPRMGSYSPIAVVSMGPVPGVRLTCTPCWTQKSYPLIFSVYTKTAGDSEDENAATIIDAIETEFINNNLGLSDDVLAPQKSYAIPANAPTFDFQILGGASMVITHIYTDIRAT
jgi:hypothetical protein